MKNRNDDKKYILLQYRKKQIKRLFNRLQQIQNKPPKLTLYNINSNSKSQAKATYNPKNLNELRLYEIKKQNQRLVDRLMDVKISVVSHRVSCASSRRSREFKSRDHLRRQQIMHQNRRLKRAIRTVSSDLNFNRSSSKNNNLQ